MAGLTLRETIGVMARQLQVEVAELVERELRTALRTRKQLSGGLAKTVGAAVNQHLRDSIPCWTAFQHPTTWWHNPKTCQSVNHQLQGKSLLDIMGPTVMNHVANEIAGTIRDFLEPNGHGEALDDERIAAAADMARSAAASAMDDFECRLCRKTGKYHWYNTRNGIWGEENP